MSSSDEEGDNMGANSELVFLANELCLHPVMLNKSQIPKIRKLKLDTIRKVVLKFQSVFGKETNAKIILKKINNMKARLKRKMDLNQSESNGMRLLVWEKKLLEAVRGKSNPNLKRAPETMQCSVNHIQCLQPTILNLQGSSANSTSVVDTSDKFEPRELLTEQPSLPPRKQNGLDSFETEATKNLTNDELQRLVLLQQLKTSEAQEQYFRVKLHYLQLNKYTPENIENIQNIVKVENDTCII